MTWRTVPNFFPEYEDLDSEDHYNLYEGYGISSYETKSNGHYYKKVRINGCDNFPNLLSFLGFTNWHIKHGKRS